MRRSERQVTETSRIAEILDSSDVCRLGINGDIAPYIVPMNFAYTFESGKLKLYFHTAKQGKKLELIQRCNKVSFEIDCNHSLITASRPCNLSYAYSSLIGWGHINIIEEATVKLNALALIVKKVSGKEYEGCFNDERIARSVSILEMEVSHFTCKQHHI